MSEEDIIAVHQSRREGIRVIKIEKFQRYCLKCGKILPLEIKQNFYHECERPDFVKDKLGI